MQFLADENVPRSCIEALRAAGHDVVAVAESAPGAADLAHLERAARESRVVVTFDRDFGELIFRAGVPAPPGVILVRVAHIEAAFITSVVLWLASEAEVAVRGYFTVLGRDQIRQRPLPPRAPGV